MKKIGIFGGTFNPIHNGHLDIAKYAYSKFNLSLIYFIPTGYSYHKKMDKVASAQDRLNMVEIAIAEFKKFKLGDFDFKRKGPSYTINTLEDIKRIEGKADYYLILGEDAFLNILSWKYIERLALEVTFLVAERKSVKKNILANFLAELPKNIREKTVFYDCNSTAISSKELRTESFDITKIPKKVYNYILEKRLYF